jgi:hypothetical protein
MPAPFYIALYDASNRSFSSWWTNTMMQVGAAAATLTAYMLTPAIRCLLAWGLC